MATVPILLLAVLMANAAFGDLQADIRRVAIINFNARSNHPHAFSIMKYAVQRPLNLLDGTQHFSLQLRLIETTCDNVPNVNVDRCPVMHKGQIKTCFFHIDVDKEEKNIQYLSHSCRAY